MTAPRPRDEHLAWLAVRDELVRSTRRSVRGILRTVLGGRNRAATRGALTNMQVRSSARSISSTGPDLGDIFVKPSSPEMIRYSLAVHEQAAKLTEPERQVLRATGRVPDWFLTAVRTAARKM